MGEKTCNFQIFPKFRTLSDVVAIDDTEIEMLVELRASGAKVFGFYNPNDPGVKLSDADEMAKRGIIVLTDPKGLWRPA